MAPSLFRKYRPQREAYWPQVEQFFGDLPPPLFRQGVLLRNVLAINHSHSGEFKDILSRATGLPLFYLHFWLLDDRRIPPSGGRRKFEKHLFLAMVYTFAAVTTQTCIADAGSTFGNEFLPLAQTLTQQAGFHLAQILPGSNLFWTHHRAIWQEHAEACLLPVGPASPNIGPVAGQLAFTKIPVVAAAIFSGEPTRLPQLLEMMDRFNFIWQVCRDLSTAHRDLVHGRFTYPLLRAINQAGLDPHRPTGPGQLAAILALGGVVNTICRECDAHLLACRRTAHLLNLPAFTRYCRVVQHTIKAVRRQFDVRRAADGAASARPRPAPGFFTAGVDPLSRGEKMARDFLLADLSFKESWAVQRGLPGLPELAARAFPSGLVVERLCRHGHNLAPQIDELFQTLQAAGFRYYNQAPLPPDADDLGLLLRLFPYAPPERQAGYRQMLQMPLGWMSNSILPSGEIPVWFKIAAAEGSRQKQASVLIWGNSCATTEANLLLGLMDYNWAGFRQIIETSAMNLLARCLDKGLGATLYYTPGYIYWAILNLMTRLAGGPVLPRLQNQLAQTLPVWLNQFERQTKKPLPTPQDAAFFILTCAFAPARRLFNPNWVTRLLKSQRYDGSWDDEPLFLVPDRWGSGWYSSRTVTTAICYDALKTCRAVFNPRL